LRFLGAAKTPQFRATMRGVLMASMTRSDRVPAMHTAGEAQPGVLLDFGSFMELREAAAGEYSTGDIEAFRAISTRHPPATLFEAGGAISLGPERVLEAYVEGAPPLETAGQTRFEVLQSAASDGLAYWVGLQRSTVRLADGAPRQVVQRVTELFRREKGEWKLIHRHADQLEVSR
jgi:ketosteroid isomerase-like protein